MILTNGVRFSGWLLEKLDEKNVVIVVAAANHALTEGVAVRRYPAKFADPNDKYGGFPNMIVVAASNSKTERADISNYSPWVTTFAPGKGIHCPAAPGSKNTMRVCQGTSFCTSAARWLPLEATELFFIR